jgi:hypothetical protein
VTPDQMVERLINFAARVGKFADARRNRKQPNAPTMPGNLQFAFFIFHFSIFNALIS